MEDESAFLEEGEIVEPCNIYENANNFTQSRVTREPQTICSEESSNDNSDISDEDSDDQCSRPKIAKSRPELPVIKKKEVPNKYKVWSQALQEETLMETMNKCDVEVIDRERNVESYNYKKADKTDYSQFSRYHMPVSECHYLDSDFIRRTDERQYLVGSKRRHHCEEKRSRHKKHKEKSFCPRRLPNLSVTSENSVEDVAEDIALKLKESKVELIMNVVLVLGKEKAIALYYETKGVEDSGGMLLMNQERRRTSGGVFFLLLKRDDTIASDAMKQIFLSDITKVKIKNKAKAKKKRKKNLEDIKETLIREKLLCLNTTTSDQSSESKPLEAPLDSESNVLEERELTVTNPPPSPATDQDTSPSRITTALSDEETVVVQRDSRQVVTYDDNDDFLEVDVVDDIDMF